MHQREYLNSTMEIINFSQLLFSASQNWSEAIEEMSNTNASMQRKKVCYEENFVNKSSAFLPMFTYVHFLLFKVWLNRMTGSFATSILSTLRSGLKWVISWKHYHLCLTIFDEALLTKKSAMTCFASPRLVSKLKNRFMW